MIKEYKMIIFPVLLATILFSKVVLSKSTTLNCLKKPLTKQERKDIERKVKSSAAYKRLLLLRPAAIKVTSSRCDHISISIRLSTIKLENILDKTCSINSINLYFLTSKGLYKSGDLYLDQRGIRHFNYTRSKLGASLSKIANNSLVTDFFKKSIFCQIEFQYDQKKPQWIIQLRDKNKKFCYIRSSIDAEKVKAIERLYAKQSQCF